MITFKGFELESPNLHQICYLGISQLVSKTRVVDFDLQGHLATSTQNFKKQQSTSISYSDLGQPRGVPNMLLWDNWETDQKNCSSAVPL